MYKFKFCKKKAGEVLVTGVEITDTENSKTLYRGYAIKSPKDKHIKAVGQKIAVQCAVSHLSREDREIVWEAFFLHSRATKKLRNLGESNG
ncbi:hypothetical protein ACFL4H_00195 [Candidatus Neomarinimicrobiota bacterium]